MGGALLCIGAISACDAKPPPEKRAATTSSTSVKPAVSNLVLELRGSAWTTNGKPLEVPPFAVDGGRPAPAPGLRAAIAAWRKGAPQDAGRVPAAVIADITKADSVGSVANLMDALFERQRVTLRYGARTVEVRPYESARPRDGMGYDAIATWDLHVVAGARSVVLTQTQGEVVTARTRLPTPNAPNTAAWDALRDAVAAQFSANARDDNEFVFAPGNDLPIPSLVATLEAVAAARKKLTGRVDEKRRPTPRLSFSATDRSRPPRSNEHWMADYGDDGNAPPVVPGTVVKLGSVKVEGPVAEDVVRAALEKRSDTWTRCYHVGLAKQPGLAGRVYARFVIDIDGVVTHVGMGGSLPEPFFRACLMRGAHNMRFAPIPRYSQVQAELDFHRRK